MAFEITFPFKHNCEGSTNIAGIWACLSSKVIFLQNPRVPSELPLLSAAGSDRGYTKGEDISQEAPPMHVN
jgi:hypothetical protein